MGVCKKNGSLTVLLVIAVQHPPTPPPPLPPTPPPPRSMTQLLLTEPLGTFLIVLLSSYRVNTFLGRYFKGITVEVETFIL